MSTPSSKRYVATEWRNMCGVTRSRTAQRSPCVRTRRRMCWGGAGAPRGLIRNVSGSLAQRSRATRGRRRLDLLGDEDAALAVAFADDRDRPLLQVHRRVEQRRELAHAHAGGEEQLRGDVRREVGERRRAFAAQEAAEVRARDHAREALRHADADARAAERVLDLAAVFLEPAEERGPV